MTDNIYITFVEKKIDAMEKALDLGIRRSGMTEELHEALNHCYGIKSLWKGCNKSMKCVYDTCGRIEIWFFNYDKSIFGSF